MYCERPSLVGRVFPEFDDRPLAHAVNPKLPFSFDPEYEAASRAYMRYHNMDPIFGISSK